MYRNDTITFHLKVFKNPLETDTNQVAMGKLKSWGPTNSRFAVAFTSPAEGVIRFYRRFVPGSDIGKLEFYLNTNTITSAFIPKATPQHQSFFIPRIITSTANSN